jgi:DNA helicase HerA-like ATPase
MGEPIEPGTAVSAYKHILRNVLEQRPAGIRRRLAEVLGKNRSFITHLSNPVYSTPIPAQYVESILAVCHFSGAERESFLAAYERAHPGRLARPSARTVWRKLELRLPDLNDPDRNAQLDRLLQDMGVRLAHLIQAPEDE